MKKVFIPLALSVCLAISLVFNVYQFSLPTRTSMTKTFTAYNKYYMRPDGTVQIKATFDWSGSNLSMVIKVNALKECDLDYVGLVFDTDKDCNLFEEVAYRLDANNMTPPHPGCNRLEDWGGISILPIWLKPEPSPWHTCTFIEGKGYTFNIEIPKDRINFAQRMLTHVCFRDADAELNVLPSHAEGIVWFEFEVYKP